jgi:hypothetical protein
MLEQPKRSPFVYVFGGLLIAATVGGILWLQRSPPSAAHPAVPARPALALAADAQPTPEEASMMTTFAMSLARHREASIQRQLPDLLAVLRLHRVPPLPANPTQADYDAAIAQQKDRIDGILVASSAFLSTRQLELYRVHLSQGLTALEQSRPAARAPGTSK